jgi:hypothetical protein
MDIDELMKKLMRWLSDPKAREVVKSVVYVIFPLIIIFALRNVSRRRPAQNSSTAIEPKIRTTAPHTAAATESLRETEAKEKKKIETQLRELFGREERILARARHDQPSSDTIESASSSEEPTPTEKDMLHAELLKLFSSRQR